MTVDSNNVLMEQASKAARTLQESNPQEAEALTRYISALRNQHVACLGDNEVLQIKDSSGRLTALKQSVKLSVVDGTLVGIPMGSNKPATNVISAFGFKRLADAAGAVVMNAPTVIVDGVEQKNPHVERDDFGNVIAVHVRSLCFRYGAHGQPQVSDRTAVFDSMTVLRADLVNKAKWKKDAFKMGSPKSPPSGGENWIEFPLNPYVSIYANSSHQEFLSLMATMMNRQKKALEITQTFAQRNAIKHLFGTDRPDNNAQSVSMEVISYLPQDGGAVQFSSARFIEAVKKVSSIAAGGDVAKSLEAKTGVTWDVTAGTDNVEALADMVDGMDQEDAQELVGSETTVNEALEAEMANIEPLEVESEPQTLVEVEPTNEQQQAFDNLTASKQMFPDEYARALQELEIDQATPFNAFEIHNALNRILG